MTPLEQVKAALEYLYNYVADNDPDATWAEAEKKLQEARAALEAATKVLDGIEWRSVDRDNMEFTATITYSQMITIRTLKDKPSDTQEMKCSACGGTRWLRKSMWHDTPICEPCFMVWYDPDKSIDQTDPQAVGALSMELKAAGKAPWVGKYAEP